MLVFRRKLFVEDKDNNLMLIPREKREQMMWAKKYDGRTVSSTEGMFGGRQIHGTNCVVDLDWCEEVEDVKGFFLNGRM